MNYADDTGFKADARIKSELERFGLSDKSARVYSALLELGGAYPSVIAEKARLSRSTVYKILLDLSIKGLINEVDKDNKIYYQIEPPERLLHFAKSRKDLADEQYERVKKIIPEIEGLYSLTPNKPKIRYFENREGIMSIFEDHVSVKKPYEMIGFANIEKLEPFMTKKFMDWYVHEKERRKISTRGILPDTAANKSYNIRMYSGIKKPFQLNDLRYIPSDQFPLSGEITIYGDSKVSIINFSGSQAVGIIIEDKAIHDMMVRIFELSWKGAA